MSQQIQAARFNALVSRLLGVAGQEAVMGDVSPEMSCVLALEVDRPEWGYIGETKLMGAGFGQAASVGNPTYARIRNPPGPAAAPLSGSIVVARLTMSLLAAGPIRIAIGSLTADRANVKQTFPVDGRWRQGTGGVAICSSDNTAFGGSTVGLIDIPANTMSPDFFDFILTPGTHVDIGTDTANVAANFTFRWRERPMDSYEQAR